MEAMYAKSKGKPVVIICTMKTTSPWIIGLSQYLYRSISEFQRNLAWGFYILTYEENKRSIKPKYVFLRPSFGEIWGWRYPEEYVFIFDIWIDFGEGLNRVDIIPITVEPEKVRYTEYYGRVQAILEDLLITGLQEQGYRIM
jgi:hypothetical protein